MSQADIGSNELWLEVFDPTYTTMLGVVMVVSATVPKGQLVTL